MCGALRAVGRAAGRTALHTAVPLQAMRVRRFPYRSMLRRPAKREAGRGGGGGGRSGGGRPWRSPLPTFHVCEAPMKTLPAMKPSSPHVAEALKKTGRKPTLPTTYLGEAPAPSSSNMCIKRRQRVNRSQKSHSPGGPHSGHGDVCPQPGVVGECEKLEHVNVQKAQRPHLSRHHRKMPETPAGTV